MITAICQECNNQFEYELKPGYPRKYCDDCAALKKAEYKAKQNNTPKPQSQVPTPQTGKHDIVISRVEKPHSYEFGKAGARHKIYYSDVYELKDHVRMLKAEGLVEEEVQSFDIDK